MADEVSNKQADALSDLLDQERTALLAGDLDQLADMYDTKDALIAAINESPDRSLQSLQMLDSKVKRNQLLLNGALEGIRTVTNRMAELRRIRQNLETYGADGKKRSIDMPHDGSVEKRA